MYKLSTILSELKLINSKKIIKLTIPYDITFRRSISTWEELGWGRGYVGVSSDHPWHGKNYYYIMYELGGVNTERELTFSSTMKKYPGYWFVGFDTMDYSELDEKYVKQQVDVLYQDALNAYKSNINEINLMNNITPYMIDELDNKFYIIYDDDETGERFLNIKNQSAYEERNKLFIKYGYYNNIGINTRLLDLESYVSKYLNKNQCKSLYFEMLEILKKYNLLGNLNEIKLYPKLTAEIVDKLWNQKSKAEYEQTGFYKNSNKIYDKYALIAGKDEHSTYRVTEILEMLYPEKLKKLYQELKNLPF